MYGGYKEYAFPHDELRPLSKTHSDSLVELGAASPTRAGYSGVALTLIDSLDTLAMMGNASEFAWAVRWVGENVSFDLDIEARSCRHAPAATPRRLRAGYTAHPHPHPMRLPRALPQVSLFETNIRILGGLLSAHLIAGGAVQGATHLAVEGTPHQLVPAPTLTGSAGGVTRGHRA